MADIFDPGGLTDWWDVPTDYFSGDMLDYSQLGGDYLNTDFGNLGGLPSTTGYENFLTDPGNMGSSGEDQWFYDTQTGQVVTGPQAQQIDPSFDWQNAAKMAIGGATAIGGLGALGLGIGSLFGGNDPKNQTTTTQTSGGKAPMTPEMQSLLGSTGGLIGSQGGVGGAPGGGGTGLLGLSDMMIQNLMGPGQGAPLGGQPGLKQPGPPGTIGYAGGTSNFNEATGQYAPGTGPQWQQQGGQQPQGGPLFSQQGGWTVTGPPGNTIGGYAPASQQGGQPQTWPAVPGSGGGYLSAPSGGMEPQQPQFQLGAPPQMPGYAPMQQQGGQQYDAMGQPARNAGGLPMTAQQLQALAQGGGQQPQGGQWRDTTGIQGQKMAPTYQQMSAAGGQLGIGGGQGPPGYASGQPQQGGGQGLIGQQSNVLGGLQNQIPQLNPAIMQALGMQAGGMAQGYLPSLSDPQAQARIQSIYQPGFDALNYNSGLALSNAREQLQQRGFQAPDIREGPTQALTAPILAAQQLGRSQLYGQMAGAQLDLASRLPMLGSQLNAQNYNTQMQPFNAGLNLAGAYNQPIQTQGQFPLSLLDILQRGQGTTQTVNTVGPQPSLTQQLGQVAPLVGAAGSLFGSAGNMLWPPQQQQPQYYSSGGMYP